MKMKALMEFCDLNMGQSPNSETYNEENIGLPFFQGNADFGEVYPKVRIWCSSPVKVAAVGDILISVRAPIGAMNIANTPCCIGRGLAALSPNPDTCMREYLYYALQSRIDWLIAQGTGSTFKAIGRKTLEGTQIPAYSLDEQQIISDTLSKTDQLITKAKAQASLLDELVKSRFVEMFGDPVDNPMGWKMKPLMEMGYCKNGMNFHTGDSGIEVHCLGVGDFKDYSVIDGTEHLPTISLNEEPSEESMLRDGDIVFVRSNGNKDLVGRCVVVYSHDTPTTYSGFCIRYRLIGDEVRTSYLLRVLKADSMRKKMTGRGANIQNLNQQILASLNIPLPPIKFQEQFAAFISEVDKSKFLIQKSLAISRILWTLSKTDDIINVDFYAKESLI